MRRIAALVLAASCGRAPIPPTPENHGPGTPRDAGVDAEASCDRELTIRFDAPFHPVIGELVMLLHRYPSVHGIVVVDQTALHEPAIISRQRAASVASALRPFVGPDFRIIQVDVSSSTPGQAHTSAHVSHSDHKAGARARCTPIGFVDE